MINNRLKELRTLMAKRGIWAYIVPTADPHQSEYLADHFKAREFISGFTGSAGTALITMDEAILWTDGRYFIQAEYELSTSEFKLYKMGVPGFRTLTQYLNDEVPAAGKIAFDGKLMSYTLYRNLLENVEESMLISNIDFISELWTDRPELPKDPVFVHDYKYSQVSPRERIEELRKRFTAKGCDYYLITALDDLAYLYSLRGNDIAYNPVAMGFGLVTRDKAYIFMDAEKIVEAQDHLAENGIEICSYNAIYEKLKELPGKTTIFFDPRYTNVELYNSIPSNVKSIRERSLVGDMKAIKNDSEIRHQKNAYIKDGVALVKFFNWVETGVPTGTVTEYLAAERLLEFRKEGADFKEESFGTIAAYGPNAAMPHYSPSRKKPVTLRPEGLFLVDSGGQYLDGTTDITRTVALGRLTKDEIYHYTMTLKSHISLMSAIFRTGMTGYYLDAFARGPLWKEKLDFNHGTGHGVGFFLNVHEGPHNIAMRENGVKIEKGMVVSIEPGVYVEGSHGIRIENIAVVVEKGSSDFGDFLGFESLSYVPLDTRPVDKELLSKEEIDWLNDYNKACYEKLKDFLTGSDLNYLEEMCKEI